MELDRCDYTGFSMTDIADIVVFIRPYETVRAAKMIPGSIHNFAVQVPIQV